MAVGNYDWTFEYMNAKMSVNENESEQGGNFCLGGKLPNSTAQIGRKEEERNGERETEPSHTLGGPRGL